MCRLPHMCLNGQGRYLNDMSKYNNLNETKKKRLAYDNIIVQLFKKNTRFQYKLIKKGGRASEFENAIKRLCLSDIVSQMYKVEQIKKPLENYCDIDVFLIGTIRTGRTAKATM